MDKFVIRGGNPLVGTVRVSGAKNSALPCMAAAILTEDEVTLENIPQVRDIETERKLLESMGARPFVTDPQSHDRAVAFLSHLPQLVSTGLASLIAEQGAEDFLPAEMAASGFRDVTRLADSPYEVWRDICLTNIENIQSALESLIEKLDTMKLHLTDRELQREFKQASRLRERLRETR